MPSTASLEGKTRIESMFCWRWAVVYCDRRSDHITLVDVWLTEELWDLAELIMLRTRCPHVDSCQAGRKGRTHSADGPQRAPSSAGLVLPHSCAGHLVPRDCGQICCYSCSPFSFGSIKSVPGVISSPAQLAVACMLSWFQLACLLLSCCASLQDW